MKSHLEIFLLWMNLKRYYMVSINDNTNVSPHKGRVWLGSTIKNILTLEISWKWLIPRMICNFLVQHLINLITFLHYLHLWDSNYPCKINFGHVLMFLKSSYVKSFKNGHTMGFWTQKQNRVPLEAPFHFLKNFNRCLLCMTMEKQGQTSWNVSPRFFVFI
jgi:hypothetical protein